MFIILIEFLIPFESLNILAFLSKPYCPNLLYLSVIYIKMNKQFNSKNRIVYEGEKNRLKKPDKRIEQPITIIEYNINLPLNPNNIRLSSAFFMCWVFHVIITSHQ